MLSMPHLVLLGDSIFDNAAYTSGGPDVVSQVRRLLPPEWDASLLAVDGSMPWNIPDQVRHLPNDCTHLVLSVGGNNALAEASRLGISFFGISGEPPAKALDSLADVSSAFESEYRSAVDACLRPKLPLSVKQFSSNALLAPRSILLRHLEDQLSKVSGHARPISRPRLPSRE